MNILDLWLDSYYERSKTNERPEKTSFGQYLVPINLQLALTELAKENESLKEKLELLTYDNDLLRKDIDSRKHDMWNTLNDAEKSPGCYRAFAQGLEYGFYIVALKNGKNGFLSKIMIMLKLLRHH